MGTDSVHDCSTRAAHRRRHRSPRPSRAVAAVVILTAALTVPMPRLVFAAASDTLQLSGVPSAPEQRGHPVVHDIAIETVSRGREGLELSARLSSDGGLIERPVTWTVTSGTGELVYSGDIPIADFAAPPGDYAVGIDYGAVHISQAVTLAEGTRLIASFVLEAGGIRILPRIEGMGLPAAPSRSLIYALAGPHKGELVAISTEPGELLRVPAGPYRIESRFDAGNASAAADVKVKPGLMSAVEIDHAAGLARLAFVGPPDAGVRWRIADAQGNALPPLEGLSADIVLKPGTYTATALVGGETLTARFGIASGETRDIILGN